MTTVQKRIVGIMTALCIVVNIAAFASGWWCDRDLAARGIVIEELLRR